MKLSDAGIEHLIQEEGFRNEAYEDQIGKLTIGIGHLLTKDELSSGKLWVEGEPIRWRHGLTDSQVMALKRQDSAWAEKAVNSRVLVPLTQQQFDVLVSLVFNIGAHAFGKSSLLRVLNAGHYYRIPAKLKEWVYGGGKKLPVLVRRRDREARLWKETLPK